MLMAAIYGIYGRGCRSISKIITIFKPFRMEKSYHFKNSFEGCLT